MPRGPYIRHILEVLCAAGFLGGIAVADDDRALLADGREVSGTLVEDPSGRLQFTSSAAAEPIPASLIQRVTFATGRAPVSPTTPLWRINLWAQDQVLTGRVVDLGRDSASLDLLGLGEISVPRGVLAGIHIPASELAVVYHDFEGTAPGWSSPGEAFTFDESRHLSGRRSIRLDRPLATTTFALPRPVDAGRVELSFWDDGNVHRGSQWLVEAEFSTVTGPQRLRVLLGWNAETFGLEAPDGPSLPVQQLARESGWRRLRIGFNRLRCLILIDDAVLTAGEGPRGPLQALRLVRRPAPGRPDTADDKTTLDRPPAVYVDDVTIHRTIDSRLHARGQSDRDEVLFDSGDQLFGDVEAIDDRELSVSGPFGTVRIPWTEVRGVLFRRQPIQAAPLEGVFVRLRFQSRLESKSDDWDTIEAVLESVTPEELGLRHPLLGTLRVPRDLAREMEMGFTGWRLEIDPSFHHLGDAVRNYDASLPAPEGNTLHATFRLDEVPVEPAWLSLQVVDLEGTGPGASYREEIEGGHLRTDVFLNDQPIDYLNRYVDRHSRVAVPIRVAIPTEALRRGTNTLELRQRPTSYDPVDYDNFQLFGLALEVDGVASP
jgi:hypothetical protein